MRTYRARKGPAPADTGRGLDEPRLERLDLQNITPPWLDDTRLTPEQIAVCVRSDANPRPPVPTPSWWSHDRGMAAMAAHYGALGAGRMN